MTNIMTTTTMTMMKQQLRKCVGCKEMIDAAGLIRIAYTKDSTFTVSAGKSKLPGRGAYICQNQNCFDLAKKTKGLERSLKRAVPPEIYAQIESAL